MTLELQPVSFAEAREFTREHHRHNDPPQGQKFCIGLNDGNNLIGVVVVGRPIARHNDDGWTAEVTRCCVMEGYPGANSKLYAAAWRAARAMGYKRLITYTLPIESGSSLLGAGFRVVGMTQNKPNRWNMPGRPRKMAEKYPTGQKTIWEIDGSNQKGEV